MVMFMIFSWKFVKRKVFLFKKKALLHLKESLYRTMSCRVFIIFNYKVSKNQPKCTSQWLSSTECWFVLFLQVQDVGTARSPSWPWTAATLEYWRLKCKAICPKAETALKVGHAAGQSSKQQQNDRERKQSRCCNDPVKVQTSTPGKRGAGIRNSTGPSHQDPQASMNWTKSAKSKIK